jgi:hypothetical protein
LFESRVAIFDHRCYALSGAAIVTLRTTCDKLLPKSSRAKIGYASRAQCAKLRRVEAASGHIIAFSSKSQAGGPEASNNFSQERDYVPQ